MQLKSLKMRNSWDGNNGVSHALLVNFIIEVSLKVYCALICAIGFTGADNAKLKLGHVTHSIIII